MSVITNVKSTLRNALLNRFRESGFYRRLLPNYYELFSDALKDYQMILDLGCGNDSPLQNIPLSGLRVGLDIYQPYLTESKNKGIHSCYLRGDLKELCFKADSFDVVILTDVIEHMEKNEGFVLLEEVEEIARKRIILITPNGFLPQEEYNGNPFQRHLSGWSADDFQCLGYNVYGVNGIKPLRKEKAEPVINPMWLGAIISDLTQPIAWRYPSTAFQLFCIKDLD